MQAQEQSHQKKKNLYYAIKKGYKIGVYQSWNECKEMTDGYPSAQFKSFTNEFDANEYLLDLAMDENSISDNDTIGEDDFVRDALSNDQTRAFTKYLQVKIPSVVLVVRENSSYSMDI